MRKFSVFFSSVLLLLSIAVFPETKSENFQIQTCLRSVDLEILFVIDASVSKQDFKILKSVAVTTLEKIPPDHSSSLRICVLTFGANLTKYLDVDGITNTGEISEKIQKIPHENDATITGGRFLGRSLTQLASIYQQKNENRASVLVILNGGDSSDVMKTKQIRQLFVRIISLSVRTPKIRPQLARIVSLPFKQNIILYKDLGEITVHGDDVISATICEEMKNEHFIEEEPKKSVAIISSMQKNIFRLRLVRVWTTSTTIKLFWLPPVVSNSSVIWWTYKISISPPAASGSIPSSTTLRHHVVRSLQPSTFYKISITPYSRIKTLKPTTFVINTESAHPTDLSAEQVWNGDGENTLHVKWEGDSTITSYEIYTSPKTDSISNYNSSNINERYLTNLTYGQKYHVYVGSKSPRQIGLKKTRTSKTISPCSVSNLTAFQLENSNLLIEWERPIDGIFDSFLVQLISITNPKLKPLTVKIRKKKKEGGEMFNCTLDISRFRGNFDIVLHTMSNNVKSMTSANLRFSINKGKGQIILENTILMSAQDGIYSLKTGAVDEMKNLQTLYATTSPSSVKKIVDVPTGVVNSVFYNKNGQNWILWIDRATSNIKATNFSKNFTLTSNLVTELHRPVGMVIDYLDNNLYWSDVQAKAIGIVNLKILEINEQQQQGEETSTKTTANFINKRFIEVENVVTLAIDHFGRYLFWNDMSGKIERSDVDGENRKILLQNEQNMRYFGLTFCSKLRKLFWVDFITNQLHSMRSDGSNRTILVDSKTGPEMTPTFLTSIQADLFWYNSASITKRSVTSQERKVLMVGNLSEVTSITSYDVQLQALIEKTTSPCSLAHSCGGVCISVSTSKVVCTGPCSPWQKFCPGSDRCVDVELFCDGIEDCPDARDEDPHECDLIQKRTCGDQFTCVSSGRCIHYNQVCDNRADCRDGSDEINCPDADQFCDFEEDLCLWRQSEEDDFDWTRHSRHTPSNFTGPNIDHTKLRTNGSYLYAEASDQDVGATTKLTSVWFATPKCIKFFYHMFGRNMGQLSIKTEDLSGTTEILWKKHGDQGYFWKTAQFSINKYGLYKIVIEATRGEDYRSDIAIDDVIIAEGLCEAQMQCDLEDEENSENICGYEIDTRSWKLAVKKPISAEEDVEESNIEYYHEKILAEDPFGVLGREWFYYNFTYDQITNCIECEGTQIVREMKANGKARLAGLVLCDSTRYKIYLGDSLTSVFKNIADGAGNGEDHCEFVGGNSFAYDVGEYQTCEGKSGYLRRLWFENVEVGSFGPSTLYYSPSYYSCEVVVPQIVIDNDPHLEKPTTPNHYLAFDDIINNDVTEATLKIPIYRNRKDLEKDDSTSGGGETGNNSSWFLRFSYLIKGISLYVKLNNDKIIWKMEVDSNDWKNTTISIPNNQIKYELVIVARRMTSSTRSQALLDNFVINNSTFDQPTNNACSFHDGLLRHNCPFEITNEENLIYKRTKENLAEMRPEVLLNQPEPFGYISVCGNCSSDSNDVKITSPALPAVNLFYPSYCVTVEYRRMWDSAEMKIMIRLASDERFVDQLNRATTRMQEIRGKLNGVFPWVKLFIEINDSQLLAFDEFILDFIILPGIDVSEIRIDTQRCPREGACNGGVMCPNSSHKCVIPEQLCDDVNDCDDWSDELGCSSGCGSLADVFLSHDSDDVVVLNVTSSSSSGDYVTSSSLLSRRCLWRLRGGINSNIEVEFQRLNQTADVINNSSVTIFDGLVGNPMQAGSRELAFLDLDDERFPKEDKFSFLFPTQQLTFLLNSPSDMLPGFIITARLRDTGHCDFICPDGYCLRGNLECDGVRGCPDGSDEKNCSNLIETGNGEKLLQVRLGKEDFGIVFGDNFDSNVANLACQQQGFQSANLPIQLVPAEKFISTFTTFYQLRANFSDFHLVQNMVEQIPYTNITFTENEKVWLAECRAYECGIRTKEDDVTSSMTSQSSAILRIIGGRKSEKNHWPWVASLQAKGMHQCGGTVISNRFILTVAHCFDDLDPSIFQVVLGAINLKPLDKWGKRYFIKRTIIHKEYKNWKHIPDWDIALVELNEEIEFSEDISSVCLPDAKSKPETGKLCKIIGYGRSLENGTPLNHLHEATLPIIDYKQCDMKWYSGKITPRMLCAGYPVTGGTGICHGDSGGPLLCQTLDGRYELTGIISWSIGCASRNSPDVFTFVQYFLPWISQHTNIDVAVSVPDNPGFCSTTFFNVSQGYIASPGWPGPYDNEVRCEYRIIAGNYQKIHLYFESYALEHDEDFIHVYEERQTDRSLVEIITGKGNDKNIPEITNSAVIVFESNWKTISKGFYARFAITGPEITYPGADHWIVIKEKRLQQVPDNLQSFYYPASSNVNTFTGEYFFDGMITGNRPTYFQMSSPGELRHKLFFHEMMGQWRIVQMDDDEEDPVKIWIYCNDTSSTPMGIELLFWIVQNEQGVDEYDLKIELLQQDSNSTDTNKFESSGADDVYISSDVIYDDVNPFDLKKQVVVANATIHNWMTSSNLQTIFGNWFPTIVDSGDSTSSVGKVAPSRRSANFENADIAAIDIISTCPNTVESNYRTNQIYIKSPRFPANYPLSTKCTWTLTAPKGFQIHLEFKVLQLERHVLCEYDYVELYSENMYGEPPHLHGKFCENLNVMDSIYVSDGNVLTVLFWSDELITKKGFRALIRAIKSIENEVLIFNCDFTNGNCGMTHMNDITTVSYKWTRHQGQTFTQLTGPDRDASMRERGFYFYLETSYPWRTGDYARISTPLLRHNEGAVCLMFAYDMFGENVGFLNIFVQVSGYKNATSNSYQGSSYVAQYGMGMEEKIKNYDTHGTFLLWSKFGQQRFYSDPSWTSTSLQFHPSSDFKVIFEGVRGDGFYGDIAIDNIKIKHGECEDTCQNNDDVIKCASATSSAAVECYPDEVCEEVTCTNDNNKHHNNKCLNSLKKRQFCLKETSPQNSDIKSLICASDDVICKFPQNSTSFDDVICDGTVHCFGGADESDCVTSPPLTSSGVGSSVVGTSSGGYFSMLNENCGRRKEKFQLPVDGSRYRTRKSSSWSWLGKLYLKGNETFLCSVIFIDHLWATCPAHCLVYQQLITKRHRQPLTLFDHVANNNWLKKLTTPSTNAQPGDSDNQPENGEGSEKVRPNNDQQLDYYVTSTSAQDDVFTVEDWIIHPGYENSKDESQHWTHDVALLKLKKSAPAAVTSSPRSGDVIDDVVGPYDDGEYWMYDPDPNDSDFPDPLEVACINDHQREDQDQEKVFFFPSDEEDKESEDLRIKCVLVGHSPRKSTDDEGTTSDWVPVEQYVPVTSSIGSWTNFFCSLRTEANLKYEDCESYWQNSTFNDREIFLRSGYKSIKDGELLNDPGSSLLCKRFDDRWFLVAMFNPINLLTNQIRPNFTKINYLSNEDDFFIGHQLGQTYLTKLTDDVNDWIVKTVKDVCPGGFLCDNVKCIPISRVCDGIIDCDSNYKDEIECASGAHYDVTRDRFRSYYDGVLEKMMWRNLTWQLDEIIPPPRDGEDEKKSWIVPDESGGTGVVRFNEITGQVTSCRWVIKSPNQNKVVVVRVPKFHENPVIGEGHLVVIVDNHKFIHPWNCGLHYYTSSPGGVITFMITSSITSQFLAGLRSGMFEFYLEDQGRCRDQHLCASDGSCVSPLMVCDGHPHCSDYSDEINCPSGCHGDGLLLEVGSGEILSENFPHSHFGNGDCIWNLVAPSNSSAIVTLEFGTFMTSQTDQLYVFIQDEETTQLYGSYSGELPSLQLVVSTYRLTIALRSNDAVGKRKIRGTFTWE